MDFYLIAVASSNQLVDVFPITQAAFGFDANWFSTYAPKLIRPAYILMVLLLVISIGIMTLKRYENSDIEKKLWNLPIIITIVAFWPALIMGLKDLIDTFNTFLIYDIFHISWEGFGFPDIESDSVLSFFGWSFEALARLLPNLSYWIIYAFYIVFFFFYAVLGTFVLAKGILFDEIDAFLEVLKEITVLFLWQTTLAILVAFIMPGIVSKDVFNSNSDENMYFLALILGVMILFVPSLTRKFANHLGSSFFPAGFTLASALIGAKVVSRGLSALGIPVTPHKWTERTHMALSLQEISKGRQHKQEILNLHDENVSLEEKTHHQEEVLHYSHNEYNHNEHQSNDSFINLSKKAKSEFDTSHHK